MKDYTDQSLASLDDDELNIVPFVKEGDHDSTACGEGDQHKRRAA